MCCCGLIFCGVGCVGLVFDDEEDGKLSLLGDDFGEVGVLGKLVVFEVFFWVVLFFVVIFVVKVCCFFSFW